MGCWNESDMLMHLPIYSGEKVYMVILEKSNFDCPCYPTHDYVPVFAIRGEYDDFGGIAYPGDQSDFLLQGINKLVNVPYADFDEFQEATHDQMNSIKTKHDERVFYKVFLRADIVDCLINQVIKDSYMDDFNQKLDELDHETNTLQAKHIISSLLYDLHYSKTSNPFIFEFFSMLYGLDKKMMVDQYRLLMNMHFMLMKLRSSWHIPSGTGSQADATKTMRLFYREGAKLLKNL